MTDDLSFDLNTTLYDAPGKHGRTGVIHTPHGPIQTLSLIHI